MREIKGIHQDTSGHTKRWFSDLDSDLFLWIDKDDQIRAFQFSIRERNIETAVKWEETSGINYYTVDDGSHPGKHPGTPLLLEDEGIDKEALSVAIDQKLSSEHPKIHDFVLKKIG